MHHHHYNNYSRDFTPTIQKVIREDLDTYVPKLRVFSTVFMILCAVSFVAFPLIGFTSINSHNNPFPIILIPFFGFGFFGFLSAIIRSKYIVGNAILTVKQQIEAEDKIEIKNISYEYAYKESDLLYVIKLMLDRGLLKGYEIIDNSVVAKKSLNLTPEGINKTSSDTEIKCPYCGKEVGEDDLYCGGCGRRL